MQPLAIFLQNSPFAGSGQRLALQFLQACLLSEKAVSRVFFYQDAVLTASLLLPKNAQGLSLGDEFAVVADAYNLPLQLCIASASRRGLVDAQGHEHIHPRFSIVGLGELAQAGSTPEKIVSF